MAPPAVPKPPTEPQASTPVAAIRPPPPPPAAPQAGAAPIGKSSLWFKISSIDGVSQKR